MEDNSRVIMTLNDGQFELMKRKEKTIEVRCYDEKRKKIKVGDLIIFCKKSDVSNKIYAIVEELKVFKSFEELYRAYPIELFGYSDKTADEMIEGIGKIYSKERQEKHGALAIKIIVCF